jgi:diguanylate cyclase (GGDEF)-like protein
VIVMGLIQWIGVSRGLLRSGRAAMLLSALVVSIIVATAGFTIRQNCQSAFDEHQRGMKSMGIVVAEQTARYVQVIDLIVREVQSRIANLDIKTPADFRRQSGTQEVHAYLAESVKNVPQADAIVLVGADGMALNWSRVGPVPRIDATGRDYFTYFKEHDDPGIFIGSLSKGLVTGKLSLFFARRISGPEGRFLGVVLGIVDVKYLSDFYQTASEHLGEAVTLLHRDGTMLMHYPNPAAAIGVKLPQGSPWYVRVAEGGGSYVTPGILSGIASLVSVHPLRDYPLVVDILLDKVVVFAELRRQTAYIIAFALAAALCVSGLFWVLARQFRWQVEQNAKLEEAAGRLSEGQQMLRSYAEMSVDWFWQQDADLRFTYDSNVPFMIASDDTGKTRRELADPTISEARWAKHEADLAARVPFRDFRFERIGSDGERHYISTSGDPVFDRNGVFNGYRGTGREITAEVRANARLAQANAELELSHQQIEAVLKNITHGVSSFDGAQRLQVWNRRYVEIYNLPPGAACVGRSFEEIVGYRLAAGTIDVAPVDYLARPAELGAANQPSSQVVTLKNGRIVVIHYQPMLDGGWVATHEDVTERHQAEASIAFLAQHDTLTRLANRALFNDRLEQAIVMAGRGSEFAVICLDLDHFKAVNDTLGHPVGDGLLQAVADRLQACVREGDTVARLGGDEFAIIQLAVAQPDHAELLTSRIMNAFHDPIDVEGHQIMTGLSVGVALAPGDGATSETLLRNADIALYLAKTEGRGTVRFFEPEMDARIQLRRTLALDGVS